ncbi:hypothetical protein M405DRAFT_811116 [Rhizopogon salebrosus TDB-379]|nr:hypothetical protein M405DRAFT_811116 [Rhizopogon salebrosus TDB-379]
MSYNFWESDSELYRHVMASTSVGEITDESYETMQPFAHEPQEIVQHSAALLECLWNDNRGPCGFTTDTVPSVLSHISAYHLRGHPHADNKVECQCRDCPLSKTIRRDTLLRHIREVHYADKYRRKN